jgi:hypothetical protein
MVNDSSDVPCRRFSQHRRIRCRFPFTLRLLASPSGLIHHAVGNVVLYKHPNDAAHVLSVIAPARIAMMGIKGDRNVRR